MVVVCQMPEGKRQEPMHAGVKRVDGFSPQQMMELAKWICLDQAAYSYPKSSMHELQMCEQSTVILGMS